MDSCKYCHEDLNGYTMPLEKNCHAWVAYPNKLVTATVIRCIASDQKPEFIRFMS